jgi:HK97 family phage prohead protease
MNRKQDTREAAPLQIRASFSAASLNEEDRTVELIFGTDAPVRMQTWDGPINEILSFDPAHVRMDRLNSGAPLLDNHNRFGSIADTILGVVESGWLDGKRGYAKVRFAKDAKATDVMEKVKDGIIRNVSVGYSVFKYEKVPSEQRGVPDTYRAVDWEPAEISLTPVPADHGAVVRSKGEIQALDAILEADSTNTNQIIHQRGLQIRGILAAYK